MFRYLNDSSELRYVETVLEEMLSEVLAEEQGESPRRTLAQAVRGKLAPHFIEPTYYVTCFCTQDDLLTQWKTYGAWGSGFSIGFDRKKLESLLPELAPKVDSGLGLPDLGRSEIDLAGVSYSFEDQRRSLRRGFDRYTELVNTWRLRCQKILRSVRHGFTRTHASVASRFKHPAFESEKEWRIIVSLSSYTRPREVRFRPSSRTIIPYIETTKLGDGRLPIVSITIGPTLDRVLSFRAVLELLSSTGYLGEEYDVDVKWSEIPLVTST